MLTQKAKQAADFIMNFEAHIATKIVEQLPARYGKEVTAAVLEELLRQPELPPEVAKVSRELMGLIHASREKTEPRVGIVVEEILEKKMTPPETAAYLNLFDGKTSGQVLRELENKLIKDKGKKEAAHLVEEICDDLAASPVADESVKETARQYAAHHYDRGSVNQKLIAKHKRIPVV